MFFSVTARGDAGNIDGHVVGPIPEWRLVPHDNNLGQRNVHPVRIDLIKSIWEKLPFWLRNHGKSSIHVSCDVKVPKWLTELGWKFDVPRATKDTLIKPGDRLEVTMAVTGGTPFDEQTLAKQRDRDIVVTVLYDGLPSGGMSWQITPRLKLRPTGRAGSRKRTASGSVRRKRRK
jgi:zinc metalloprotease ZmpB